MIRNVGIRGRSKNLVAYQMKPFYNFLPLPIVGKSSILNVAEFPDLSWKTSECTETSPVSCENQSFFLLFRNVVAVVKSLHYFLPYDEELVCSLSDVCFHYFVFIDPVNGYSRSKLLVKQQVLRKSKIGFGCVCLLYFLLSQFSALINLQLTC